MKIKLPSMRRPKYALVALVLSLTGALPLFVLTPKATAAQLTDRSVTISSNAINATGVTYEIKFTPTNNAIQGIVIDFCSNSPIIGAACTAPGGLTIGASPTATISSATNITNANWTEAAQDAGPPYTTLEYKGTAAQTPTGSEEITIVLTGVTNPSAVGTFYARMFTYATAGAVDSYDDETPGTHVDDGAAAMSTAQQVSVSGTVMETLTFCVSGPVSAAPPTTCSSTTAPTLTLGHGTPATLDASAIDTGVAYSLVSTNAGGGISIRMKNSNACGGLSKDNGSNCQIAAANSGGATPESFSNGESKFGMRAASTGGTGTLTIDSTYSSGTDYGMDTTTSDNNVTSTYGSEVASSTGVLDGVRTDYTFAAGASNTTPAGLYTATMSLIATGTY
jgi:hypothetical protein